MASTESIRRVHDSTGPPFSLEDWVATQKARLHIHADARLQFQGVTMPNGLPVVHQGKAYTSPIWYTPETHDQIGRAP